MISLEQLRRARISRGVFIRFCYKPLLKQIETEILEAITRVCRATRRAGEEAKSMRIKVFSMWDRRDFYKGEGTVLEYSIM